MGERLLCKQEVIGSIPFTSTTDATRFRALLSTPAAARFAPRVGARGQELVLFLGRCGYRGCEGNR